VTYVGCGRFDSPRTWRVEVAKIGVQAMMLKAEFEQHGAYATLKRLGEVGFHVVELSQIPMTAENVDEIDRARVELGVDIAAVSAMLEPTEGLPGDSLARDFDKVVGDCARLDTRIVRIGMMPFPAMASRQALLDFCKQSDEMAARLSEHGIGLYYHNHHVEFAKYDGRYILDIMRDRAPRLKFELDVHWIHRGGRDPVSVLKEYAGLVDLVHLKDYRIGQMPEDAFASLSAGDLQSFMAAFEGIVQFAEIGEGNLDFTSIIEQSLASGAKYLLIEQDKQYGRDPFDCLATSRKNLIALGYQSLI
jgi:sugar phosphate isomerase/epimerase